MQSPQTENKYIERQCQYKQCSSPATVRCWQCALYLCETCLSLAHKTVQHRVGSIVPLNNTMELIVSYGEGPVVHITIPSNYTVDQAYSKICESMKCDSKTHILLLDGKRMNGNTNISYYITTGSKSSLRLVPNSFVDLATLESATSSSPSPVLSYVLLMVLCNLPNAFQLGLAVNARDLIELGVENAPITAILQSKAVKYVIQRVAKESRALVETMRAQADFWLINGFLLKYHCTITEADADTDPLAGQAAGRSRQSYVYTFCETKMVNMFIKAYGQKLTSTKGTHHDEEVKAHEEIRDCTEKKMPPWTVVWLFPQRSFVSIIECEKVMISPSVGRIIGSDEDKKIKPAKMNNSRWKHVRALLGKLESTYIKHVSLGAQAAGSSHVGIIRSWITESKLDQKTNQHTIIISGCGNAGSHASAMSLEHELKIMGSSMVVYFNCTHDTPTRDFIASLHSNLVSRLQGFKSTTFPDDVSIDEKKLFKDYIISPLTSVVPDVSWSVARCIVIDALNCNLGIARFILDPEFLSSVPIWLRIILMTREDFNTKLIGSGLTLPQLDTAGLLTSSSSVTLDETRSDRPSSPDGPSGDDEPAGERKENPLMGSRKRTHSDMMECSPPLVTIESIGAKAWNRDSITQFHVSKTDYVMELAKAKLLVPYLQANHKKCVKTGFVKYIRRLATLLNAEHFLAPEQRRFPPTIGENKEGSYHRIENILCIRVISADRLMEDLRKDLPSRINPQGHRVYKVPIDGNAYEVIPELSRVILIEHAYYFVTALTPSPRKAPKNRTLSIRPVDHDGDDLKMSDPSQASSEDKSSDTAHFEYTPYQQAVRAGDRQRIIELGKGVISRLNAKFDDRKAKQSSVFVRQPIELFWFTCNFFLTARDCCNLSQVCSFTFTSVYTNAAYWNRAFRVLSRIPLYINPDIFNNDVEPIRRWSIITMIKRRTEQRVYDYNSQVDLARKLTDEEAKSEKLNTLKSQFLQKKHACPVCFNQVTFQYQLNSSISKKNGFGAVFMACDWCTAHEVWSHTQALVIWGFTNGQLKELAHYIMRGSEGDSVKFYLTSDLLWLRTHKYPYYTCRASSSQITPKQRSRLSDLPPVIAMHLKILEHTVDQQGVVWERRINAATGTIVEHDMRPVGSSDVHSATPLTAEPAEKKQRVPQPASETKARDKKGDREGDVGMSQASILPYIPQMPAMIGNIGVVPMPGFLPSGYNSQFVAFHGTEAVPVLASWIEHSIARPGTYNARVFDPPDDEDSSDDDTHKDDSQSGAAPRKRIQKKRNSDGKKP